MHQAAFFYTSIWLLWVLCVSLDDEISEDDAFVGLKLESLRTLYMIGVCNVEYK
jgi:hypothetical protein